MNGNVKPLNKTNQVWQHWQTELMAALTLSLPMAGAQLAQVALSFTDALMCGQLGAVALAGAGLGTAALSMVLLPLLGLVQAVSPLMAQAQGAQDERGLRQSLRQALLLALALGFLAFGILSVIPQVLLWIGEPQHLVQIAHDYLGAVRWSLIPALLVGVLRGGLDALSRPRPGLVISLSAVGLNLGLNWLLVFGKWGFPALGVAGSGWATTLVSLWMLLAFLWVFRAEPSLRKHDFVGGTWQLQEAYLRELLRVGLPMCLAILAEVWLFCSLSFLMGKLGPVALAAHQVALNLTTLTFMFALGVANASTVRVGQAMGRGEPAQARRAGAVGMLLGMIVMSTTGLAFWLIPTFLIGLFLDLHDPGNLAVADVAVVLLHLATFFQIFDALQVTSQGALRGLKDTFVPMLMGFVCYWLLGFGGALILAFGYQWGAKGLWMGLILGLSSAGLSLAGRFFSHFSASGRLEREGGIQPLTESLRSEKFPNAG